MSNLTVAGDVTINSNLIVSNALAITSNGTITVNNQKITGLSTPLSARVANELAATEDVDSSAATKGYVNTEVAAQVIAYAFDATGLSNPSSVFSDNIGPHEDIRQALEYLHPAATKTAGTYARIYATTYIGTAVSGIDVNSALTKSTVNV